MVLINLFIAFLRVEIFAFGGADSLLPLIEKEIVERYHWLTPEEFLDMLGAAKILPGALSIKFATYTGYKISGMPGVIAANLGNFIMPAALMFFVSSIYLKYKDLPAIKSAFGTIQLAIFAMIIALAFRLVDMNQLTNPKNIIIIIGSFVLFVYTRVHPAFIVVGAGILGVFLR